MKIRIVQWSVDDNLSNPFQVKTGVLPVVQPGPPPGKNEESLRENKKKWGKFEGEWGKWNSCTPGTVRLATPLGTAGRCSCTIPRSCAYQLPDEESNWEHWVRCSSTHFVSQGDTQSKSYKLSWFCRRHCLLRVIHLKCTEATFQNSCFSWTARPCHQCPKNWVYDHQL